MIFDRRKKASAVNPGTVEIEVSYNRERVRLSTGVAVLKQQWNGREVVNHPEADRLNEQIRRVYDGLHEKMATIASKKGEYDLSLLKKVKKTKVQGSSGSFLDWLEERIYMRPVTESTRRQHLVMLKCLREFGLIRFFCDLTPKNIRLWDDFIRKRVTAQSSVHGYHKRVKPYIIEAIQFEKLEANPYDGMRISRGKSEGIKFLTEEERDRVEALEFQIGRNQPYLGQPLMKLRLKPGTLIACINRRAKTIIPSGGDTIEAGDSVIVVAAADRAIQNFSDIFAD